MCTSFDPTTEYKEALERLARESVSNVHLDVISTTVKDASCVRLFIKYVIIFLSLC